MGNQLGNRKILGKPENRCGWGTFPPIKIAMAAPVYQPVGDPVGPPRQGWVEGSWSVMVTMTGGHL